MLSCDWPPAFWLSLLLATALPLALMPLLRRRRKQRLGAGTHVLITGGSKGLGLCLAKECVRRGCSVTIVARNKQDLAQALQQLQAEAAAHPPAVTAAGAASSPRLQALSADTGDAVKIGEAFDEAEQHAGPIDVLICNAGLSVPGLFVEQEVEVFERQMRVNYLGTVHSIKAAVPGMLRRGRGSLVVVSSTLGVLGFAGYCSYAPTKWALRGLAESLHNELQGTGVLVSIAYPPDMDTPGYAQENETKPALCNAVERALGSELYSADKAARALLGGIERGQYHLPSPDFGQNLLVASVTGLSPKRFLLLLHVLMGAILPLVTSVFAWLMTRAAWKHNTTYGMPPRVAASS